MKYSEAKQGRTFIIRLEDGDILHEKIEEFARELLTFVLSLPPLQKPF